jgi:hypothetical protein
LGWPDDAVRDGGGLAPGFVGVEAVVADGLLALGREVEQSGGDEGGGFEDLEVALCSVMAFGAVDDGLAGGVPGDFLEGKGVAEEVFRQTLAAGGVVGDDVEVRVEDEVVSEGVDSGDGSDAAVGEAEAGADQGRE